MKVLLINDFLYAGGAEGVFRDTYEVLQAHGVDVKLFYGTEQQSLPKNVLAYFYNTEVKKRLLTLLQSFTPNIIHIHNYYHVLSPSIFRAIATYRKEHPVKVVFTAHDHHLISPAATLLYFKNKRATVFPEDFTLRDVLWQTVDPRSRMHSILKKLFWIWSRVGFPIKKEIDLITAPSLFVKRMLEERLKRHDEVLLLRNPLRFDPEYDPRLKIPLTQQIRFTFVGRLSQEKGMAPFLEAFSTLLGKHNVFLDILGEGPERETLTRLCATLNLENHVKFHGFVSKERVRSFLIQNTILVQPSIGYESAGLSLVEGAALGNVVMVSKRGGMIELAQMTQQYYLIEDWKKELLPAVEEVSQRTPRVNTIDTRVFSKEHYGNTLLDLYNKKTG